MIELEFVGGIYDGLKQQVPRILATETAVLGFSPNSPDDPASAFYRIKNGMAVYIGHQHPEDSDP